jgi:hypothetical protein
MGRATSHMSERLSREARHILDQGVLCYLATRGPRGPHLTPVVYVLDGGRIWVTTARGSVKARIWRRDPVVAGMVRAGERTLGFRGRVRTYDALDPVSWPAAALSGPRLVRATIRFSLKNARFFAGYAVDARRVPLAWTPPGRVFAAVRMTDTWIVDPAGHLETLERLNVADRDPDREPDGPSQQDGRTRYRRTFPPRLEQDPPLDEDVPSDVRESVGTAGRGALAVEAGGRLTVLPVGWSRDGEGTYLVGASADLFELTGASRDAPVALTVDHASSWRAADMAGMLLQGTGHLFSPEATTRGRAALRRALDQVTRRDESSPPAAGGRALLVLRPERVVWWAGWTSGTLTPGPHRAARRARA